MKTYTKNTFIYFFDLEKYICIISNVQQIKVIYIFSEHKGKKKLRIKSDKFEQRKTIPKKSIRFMYFLHKENHTK